MADTIPTHRLSEGAILKMLKTAVEKAREIKAPMGIGIVDAGGTLRAWVLMEGASPLAYPAVLKKAKTAAYARQPSGKIPAEIANLLAMAMPDFTNLEGGLPIMKGPEVLGAIGVGGGLPEADLIVARAGLATLTLEP